MTSGQSMTNERTHLRPDDVGVWCVLTMSGSLYIIDLDNRTARRAPDDAKADPRTNWFYSVPLRKDDEVVALVAFENIVIGERPLLLLHRVNDDPGFVTYRQPTPVVRIFPYREALLGMDG